MIRIKLSFIINLIFLLSLSSSSPAQQFMEVGTRRLLQLQTNYPAPMGIYKNLATTYLQLNETSQGTDSFPVCDTAAKGKMYYDEYQNQILMCNGEGNWISNFNLWTKDDVQQIIYPADIADENSKFSIGIGTQQPKAQLSLQGDGSILAQSGTCFEIQCSGPPPGDCTITSRCRMLNITDDGPKLIWYPGKSAFRAGTAMNGNWNDSNIGQYSVALGIGTLAFGSASTIPGGYYNEAHGSLSTIAGGRENKAYGNSSVVGGGKGNSAGYIVPTSGVLKADYTTVSGGLNNLAQANYSTVGGGESNTTNWSAYDGAIYSTISGGKQNTTSNTGIYATISGGAGNKATGSYSTIGGGGDDSSTTAALDGHIASGDYSTIGGGLTNIASGLQSTVAGGRWNTASAEDSTVGGGDGNQAFQKRATVAGGLSNKAGGIGATVSGGQENEVYQSYATIAGGCSNIINASSPSSPGDSSNTISGGWDNTLSGSASVIAGGSTNTIDATYSGVLSGYNNKVTGNSSVILGGAGNAIASTYSVVAGLNMQTKAHHTFAFGWSDTPVEFNTAESFMIYSFYTGLGITNPDKTKRLHVAGPVKIDNRKRGPAGTNYDRVALTVMGQFGYDIAYFTDSAGIVRGTIKQDGAYIKTSDIRFKKDIQPIPHALKRVSQLQGVNYRWKDESIGTGLQMGLIAQDVEKIFPEVVSTDEQGYKSLDYSNLVAALTEAIKELKSEVDHLKEENKQFKEQIKTLQKK